MKNSFEGWAWYQVSNAALPLPHSVTLDYVWIYTSGFSCKMGMIHLAIHSYDLPLIALQRLWASACVQQQTPLSHFLLFLTQCIFYLTWGLWHCLFFGKLVGFLVFVLPGFPRFSYYVFTCCLSEPSPAAPQQIPYVLDSLHGRSQRGLGTQGMDSWELPKMFCLCSFPFSEKQRQIITCNHVTISKTGKMENDIPLSYRECQ